MSRPLPLAAALISLSLILTACPSAPLAPNVPTTPEPTPAPTPTPTPTPTPEPTPEPVPHPTPTVELFKFTIDPALPTNLTTSLQQAANRWNVHLTGQDLTNTTLTPINMTVRAADLPNNVAATLQITQLRPRTGPGPGLPAAATLTIDSENLDNTPIRDDLLTHELGHALGIGTLWDLRDLINTDQCDTQTTPITYTGQAAATQWATDAPSKNALQAENNLGSGSRCSHWDQDQLRGDVMSAVLREGGMALTDIDKASLRDLGYATTTNPAPAKTRTAMTGITTLTHEHHAHELERLLPLPQHLQDELHELHQP